ncbi:MAG: ComEC/Rec2 family competence protein [Candidatus Moranbacteria bacterium]|nr:ComEC/Rec2 family competence protein [Candidatus Moranbacteria bacterium]
MPNRKLIYFSLGILLTFGLIFFGVNSHAQNQKLQVAFLDVGQGDAILISDGEKQILIDGGPSGTKLMEKLGEYVPFWDRKIDVVIATHPDADHITGLVDVLKNYSVDQVIESGAQSESQVFGALEKIISDKKVEKQIARRGMKVKLSDDAELEVFSPTDAIISGLKDDTNLASIVAKLTYGENSFLFTGDLPLEADSQLISSRLPLSANVLKIAHHGSKSATSAQWLELVHPKEAVISVGKDNRYGHPTAEVLSRLQDDKIRILRTDQQGDVVYDCASVKSDCELTTTK